MNIHLAKYGLACVCLGIAIGFLLCKWGVN